MKSIRGSYIEHVTTLDALSISMKLTHCACSVCYPKQYFQLREHRGKQVWRHHNSSSSLGAVPEFTVECDAQTRVGKFLTCMRRNTRTDTDTHTHTHTHTQESPYETKRHSSPSYIWGMADRQLSRHTAPEMDEIHYFTSSASCTENHHSVQYQCH